MKKFISVLMVIAMLLGFTAVMSSAEGYECMVEEVNFLDDSGEIISNMPYGSDVTVRFRTRYNPYVITAPRVMLASYNEDGSMYQLRGVKLLIQGELSDNPQYITIENSIKMTAQKGLTLKVFVLGSLGNIAPLSNVCTKSFDIKPVSFRSEEINDENTSIFDRKIAVNNGSGAYDTYYISPVQVLVNGGDSLAESIWINGVSISEGSSCSSYKNHVLVYYLNSSRHVDIELSRSPGSAAYDIINIVVYKDYIVDYVNPSIYGVYAADGRVFLNEANSSFEFIIYKNGKKASFADIAENDVLSISGYINENRELEKGTVIISSEKVSGRVEAVNSDDCIVTVSGSRYFYNDNLFTVGAGSGFDVHIGDQAAFYVNARGVLVGFNTEGAKTNLKYGFATAFGRSSGIGSAWKLILCDTEGKWQTLDLNTKVDFNDKGSVSVSDYQTNYEMSYLTGITNEVDGNLLINNVVAYELNDSGKINKLYTTATRNEDDMFYYSNTTSTYNASAGTLGIFDLNDSVVIFSVESDFDLTSWEVKADDLYVGSVGGLIDRETYTITGYNADKNGVPAVMFGIDIIGAVSFASDFFVVSSKTTKENADGELGVELTGLESGEKTTVFIADDADIYKMDYWLVTDADEGVDPSQYTERVSAGDISKGDVLILSRISGSEANKVYILASAWDLYDSNNAFIYNAYGDQPKLITFEQGDTTYSYYLAYVMNREDIRMTIAQDMDLYVGERPAEYPMKLSMQGVKGAAFDINLGAGGIVKASSYQNINYDKSEDLTGDLVFMRVANLNQIEEFVNFVYYNDWF